MPEKIRKPSEENPSADTDSAFVPTASEENVLADIHEKASLHRKEGKQSDPELVGRLHKDIEQCECSALFNQYASGEVPTLKAMFANLQSFLDAFAQEVEKEKPADGESSETHQWMSSTHKLLSGREQTVRSAIQRYVNSVIRFKNLHKLAAGGSRDLNAQFVDADHARRRAHNALIEALSIYTEKIRSLAEEGFNQETMSTFRFKTWDGRTDARTFGSDAVVFFSPEVLRNRDFLRDWAIVADFKEQLEILGDTA